MRWPMSMCKTNWKQLICILICNIPIWDKIILECDLCYAPININDNNIINSIKVHHEAEIAFSILIYVYVSMALTNWKYSIVCSRTILHGNQFRNAFIWRKLNCIRNASNIQHNDALYILFIWHIASVWLGCEHFIMLSFHVWYMYYYNMVYDVEFNIDFACCCWFP